MNSWSKQFSFQVDIAGVIELMGASLYSRPDVSIRELIQNAHDGIMRRRKSDLNYRGRIDIRQSEVDGTLQFSDDGIGLSADEAERYLGTLGVGITGMIKKGVGASSGFLGDGGDLIGQFGVGLFSAFMLAERVVVESRRVDSSEGIRWQAGPGTEIALSSHERATTGTTVTLYLKPEHRSWASDAQALENSVRQYAEFLPVPIFLNDSTSRINTINAAWLDPTPDVESLELELEAYFHETPLDIIPVRTERPALIRGAIYVTPQRVPGFSGEATLAVTVRRMVISRRIQGLLPDWAPFLRGVIELPTAALTASREDLVHDDRFAQIRATLEELILARLETMAAAEPTRLNAIVAWHRYTLAGAALSFPRLRRLLRSTYLFTTSNGEATFDQILARSEADPLFESEVDFVLWYNPDRRQEQWMNTLFAAGATTCVHALRSFEQSLLAAMAADEETAGRRIDLRIASPLAGGFATQILGVRDLEDAPPAWQDFLADLGIKVLVASFDPAQAVIAFLNERRELKRTLKELKKEGTIPAGFQRMIDAEFGDDDESAGEVILNRRHRLVGRALSQSARSPLAGVLRLLVLGAMESAGLAIDAKLHRRRSDDLEWIAEALWGAEP